MKVISPKTGAAVAACALVLLVASAARAQPLREPQTVREPSPKRPVPDYDGLQREEAEAGGGWWLLRVPLAPVYAVTDLLLRRPLAFVVAKASKKSIPEHLYNFFLFAPDHKGGILPTAFAEFAFQPSVGAFAFWEDAFFVKGNDFRAHYEAWPTEWVSAWMSDSQRIDARTDVAVRVGGYHRPDSVFYGVGPSSSQTYQSRFTEERFEGEATLRSRLWRSSGIELSLGVRKVGASHGHFGDDPSIEQAAEIGLFPLPFGFDRPYTDPYARALVRFDTRVPGAHAGSGIRLEGQMEHGAVYGDGFVRWGVATTGFWDITGHSRILSLSVATLFADPLRGDSLPFTELVMLGGQTWMTGFYRGRLLGRSGAVAELAYTWPVASAVNASIQMTFGNVFGPQLEGFDPKLLKLSSSFGLGTTTEPPLEVTAGFGTDTFANGARVESFRFSFGVPHRF